MKENTETLKADLKEELKNNNNSINNKIDKNNRNNNKNMETLNNKIDDVSKRIEENNEKINAKIGGEITGIRREIAEVHKKCEQYYQELTQAREETVSYTHLDVYKRQVYQIVRSVNK